MSTLQDLLAQRADLEKQIANMQSEARVATIAKVKAMMAEFGLTAADISGRASSVRAAGAVNAVKAPSKVAAKYRNNATGDTWTGRGLQPKWLKAALADGAKIDEFTI